MLFVGKDDSRVKIPKFSVLFAKRLLKTSAIPESLVTSFPSSIKVIDEFNHTLSEHNGLTVFQNL